MPDMEMDTPQRFAPAASDMSDAVALQIAMQEAATPAWGTVALFVVEIKCNWHHGLSQFTQYVFEKRVPSLAEDEAAAISGTDTRHHAAELVREFGLCEDQFQTRQSLGGGSNFGGMQTQTAGEFA